MAVVVAVGLWPSVGRAQIDVAGRWQVTFTEPGLGLVFERPMVLEQNGAVVTVAAPSPYTGGTIDTATGALHLDGSGTCSDIFTGMVTIVPWTIDAVVAADGATFAGTFGESIQPTRACLAIGGSVGGVRVPATCGNGVLDSGEECDAGPEGGECCTATCSPVAAGSSCTAATDICGRPACDGAGACAILPQPAGALCRAAAGACDTAEFCDGVAGTCPPPSSPTEPDVDGDGILDPCDDCVGAPLEAVQVRLGRFVSSSVRDRVQLRARVRLPAAAALPDPPSAWKRVELRDADGRALLFSSVPGGLWEPVLREGWRHTGERWIFRSDDDTPVSGAVSRMSLMPVAGDPGLWDVRVDARRATLLDVPPTLPLSLTLILDGLGPSTACGQRRLAAVGGPPPACRGPSPGGVIVCR